ncbi:MAG TPA: phosphoribosylamine--glycine ligase, partial [Rhodobacteraceae bacterium]|nr:phosphoribosylamine--glycine ligase [Paracoccaceae bacterium]
ASFFVLSDGKTALPMGSAQDHKRAFDNDEGPNTGGMGAYSPAPVMTPAITKKAMDEIVQPTLDEMAKRGTPFQGVLFVGLMIKDGQPRLVEYNVRFGDPEIQAIAMRLGGQVLDLLLATAEGTLADTTVNWADDHALTIVMAANGYPGDYAKGEVIGGLGERSPQVKVFHAGTAISGDNVISNGGRVLAITARGETLADAHARAYARLKRIDWPGGFARSDIGWRAL